MAYGELGPDAPLDRGPRRGCGRSPTCRVVPADPAQTRAAVRWAAGEPPARCYLRVAALQGARRHARRRAVRARPRPCALTRRRRRHGRSPSARWSRARCDAAERLRGRGRRRARAQHGVRRPARRGRRRSTAARETRGIVTAEEATVSGGLGAAVASLVVAAPARSPMRILGVTRRVRADRQRALPARPLRAHRRRHRRRGPRRAATHAPPDHVLAIDQGTSATKAVLVDARGRDRRARQRRPSRQSHPRPGWVEQDADEIWASVRAAVASCLAGGDGDRVAAVGLSTQRESLLLWDRATGEPLGPMLSWQDQRTAPHCAAAARDGAERRSGRSAACRSTRCSRRHKARWLLDARPRPRRSRRGELCLGTVDSWLLTPPRRRARDRGRQRRAHAAARRPRARAGSPTLLDLFGIPREALPTDRPVAPARSRPPADLAPAAGRHARARRDGRLPRRAVRPRRLAAGPGQGHLRHRLLDHEPRRPRRRTAGGALPDRSPGTTAEARATPSRATSARRGAHAHVAGRAVRHDARRAGGGGRRVEQRRRAPRPGLRRPGRPVVGRRGASA